tara:strand:+ start:49 stop:477 length:429 start_codon:yes stop_codon:yes gene_type:complete
MAIKLENHWFKHDMNASTDNKIIKLEFKNGLEGYAVFFKVIELLMSNDGKIENNIELICNFLRTTNQELVSTTINDFDLFVIEDGYIYNERVDNQLNEITEKSKKARKSANKRWNKEKSKQMIPNKTNEKEESTNKDWINDL